MICAFLAHSSADKAGYVRIVAEKLGPQQAKYDEYTFEAGMMSIEEIIRGLNESQIFVVFLSGAALNSEWVKTEILLAYDKLVANELQRIFPIIIDSSITHLDTRIPKWMRDDYNLKYVARPTVAARRIRQRLREISWAQHPHLKERDAIFVGRNELVGQIEQRVDDLEQGVPTCFVASGLPRIGRSALLSHALIKCNAVRQSYEFPAIALRHEESLEDLIVKLYDLGFSPPPYPTDLMNLSIDERINLAETIVRDIQAAQEIVLVRDEGCLINNAREFQPWFDEILRRIATRQKPTFMISARYRPLPETIREKHYVFSLSVPELNYPERRGLFRRLTEFENLALAREDFVFFCGLFHGFPDQIRFACEMIREMGLQDTRKESHLLTDYNSDKAATILARYATQQKALDFLYLLSEFEFISLDILFSIVPEVEYAAFLNEFIAGCICDYVGVEKEFVRLNDVIRDYVRRNRLKIPEEFRGKLNKHLNEFLTSPYQPGDRDVSDILYSLKEGIKAGRPVPDKYLVPSHFLLSIQELYQERGHLDRVIELADRLLAKEHLLDSAVAQNVRHYLCLSLARKRDPRMLTEVQKIHQPDHNFLLGFYYRLQGRPDDAIQRLTRCLNSRVATQAKRELVQVYLSIEDFDAASVLAQTNYEENRRNPFHIQAYFNTIVNSRQASERRDILQQLIDELYQVNSEVAIQMADIAKAEMLAKCDNNYPAACDAIDDAIQKYPDNQYPLLAKAFHAAKNADKNRLQTAYDQLEQVAKERTISDTSLARLKSYLIAMSGDLGKAIAFAESNLRRCPSYSLPWFIERLKEAHTKTRSRA